MFKETLEIYHCWEGIFLIRVDICEGSSVFCNRSSVVWAIFFIEISHLYFSYLFGAQLPWAGLMII